MDQLQKIHNVLGTPSPDLLAQKFKRNASHMDFNFPEKKGTGIERLIPHASGELTTLMSRLIRYDPDERCLARQALKDSYFRELREADKEEVRSGATNVASSSKGLEGQAERQQKMGTSASSSSISIGPPETSGGLPTIQPQKGRHDVDASPTLGTSEDEDDDGTVLPPIGGGAGSKGKPGLQRSSKGLAKPFKAAANASLQAGNTGMNQKALMGVSGGVHPSSKTGASMSSTSANQGWGGKRAFGSDVGSHPLALRGNASSNTSASTIGQKMNSTWAPNPQSKKYVSPFGHKQVQSKRR